MEPLNDEQRKQVEKEIYAGRRIQAVKLYRQFTQVDLQAGMLAVQDMAKELEAAHPERSIRKTSGCGTSALVAIALVALAPMLVHSLRALLALR
jgi:hypothetical protein